MAKGWPERSSSAALDVNDLDRTPDADEGDPDWYRLVAAELADVLDEQGLSTPPRRMLADRLPFDAPTPKTVLRRPPYRVWDAMFHWSD